MNLVARHSNAILEAELRGIGDCRAMAYAVEVERRYRGLAPLPAGEQVTA